MYLLLIFETNMTVNDIKTLCKGTGLFSDTPVKILFSLSTTESFQKDLFFLLLKTELKRYDNNIHPASIF